MGVISSIILGDNPFTFTLSFILNLCFLAAAWFFVKPLVVKVKQLEEDNKSLREGNDKKDDELFKVSKLHQEKMDRILDAIQRNETLDDTELLRSMEILLSRYAESQSIDHSTLKELMEQIRATQLLTQGILMGNSMQESITKVK